MSRRAGDPPPASSSVTLSIPGWVSSFHGHGSPQVLCHVHPGLQVRPTPLTPAMPVPGPEPACIPPDFPVEGKGTLMYHTSPTFLSQVRKGSQRRLGSWGGVAGRGTRDVGPCTIRRPARWGKVRERKTVERQNSQRNQKKSSIRFVKGTIYKSVTYFTRLGFTD